MKVKSKYARKMFDQIKELANKSKKVSTVNPGKLPKKKIIKKKKNSNLNSRVSGHGLSKLIKLDKINFENEKKKEAKIAKSRFDQV